MNRVCFLDELVRLDAMRPLIEKHAYGTGEGPAALGGSDPTPSALPVRPADAKTRLPRTAHRAPTFQTSQLGDITPAAAPIDRERFSRVPR